MAEVYQSVYAPATSSVNQSPPSHKNDGSEGADFDTDQEDVMGDDDEETENGEDDTKQLPSEHVRSFFVSIWDNTVGPKTLRVWHGKKSKLDADLITFLTRFTVIDEIARVDVIGENIEIKFNLLADVGIMVLTAVFQAKYKTKNNVTLFAISLVLNKTMLSKYMTINAIIKEKMITLANLLKSFCHVNYSDIEKTLNSFEMQLFDFIHLFDSLNKTGISSSYVSDTLFAKQFADSHERDFLASAITSHLQTHCCSVVVGTNVDEINLWVNTLASFLMPLERNLCKLAIDTQLGKSDFVPELFVQGICFDAKKHAQVGKQNPPLWKMAVPIRGVLSGRYPITVIDLTQKVVMTFKLYNFFFVLKKDFLTAMNGSRKDKPLPDDHYYRLHFTNSSVIVPSVKKLFETIFSIPLQLRLPYVAEWMRILVRRALVLAKFVEREISQDQQSLIHKPYLRALLDLPAPLPNSGRGSGSGDEELNILLAAAEKIQKGVYIAVTGDPESEAESVIQFLEGV